MAFLRLIPHGPWVLSSCGTHRCGIPSYMTSSHVVEPQCDPGYYGPRWRRQSLAPICGMFYGFPKLFLGPMFKVAQDATGLLRSKPTERCNKRESRVNVHQWPYKVFHVKRHRNAMCTCAHTHTHRMEGRQRETDRLIDRHWFSDT